MNENATKSAEPKGDEDKAETTAPGEDHATVEDRREDASSPLTAGEPLVAHPPSSARMTRRGSGARKVLVLLVLLVAAGAGAYSTRPLWQPYVPLELPELPGMPDFSMGSLFDPGENPVDSLAARVAQLEDEARRQAATPPPTLPDLAELETRRAAMATELAQVLARVEALESHVQTMASMVDAHSMAGPAQPGGGVPAATSDSDAAVQSLLGRVDKLESSLTTALAQRTEDSSGADANKALATTVEQLAARLEALEKGDAQAVEAITGARATVLAVGQLREALRGSSTFAAELQALQSVAGDRPELLAPLEPIAARASKGIPSFTDLRSRYDNAAANAARAARTLEGDGWMEQAVNHLSSLISLRRVDGDAATDPVDAALARAESALAQADLEVAVEAAASLEGKPGAAIAPWLDDARARLEAERAMAALHVHAVSLLAAPKEEK